MARPIMKTWTPTVRPLDSDLAERGQARFRLEPAYSRLSTLIDEALSGYEVPDSKRPLAVKMKPASHVPLPAHWAKKAS